MNRKQKSHVGIYPFERRLLLIDVIDDLIIPIDKYFLSIFDAPLMRFEEPGKTSNERTAFQKPVFGIKTAKRKKGIVGHIPRTIDRLRENGVTHGYRTMALRNKQNLDPHLVVFALENVHPQINTRHQFRTQGSDRSVGLLFQPFPNR